MSVKSIAKRVDSKSPESNCVLVAESGLALSQRCEALRAAGFAVFDATSGERAMLLAAGNPIGLAVLTGRLPDMSGVELAQALFERHGLYSILLSQHDVPDVLRAEATKGLIGHICGPQHPTDLAPSVRIALSRIREIKCMREREQQLRAALADERDINTAVGVLMERLRMTREAAFERLRNYARSHRQRIAEIARTMLSSTAESHRLAAALMASQSTAAESATDRDD